MRMRLFLLVSMRRLCGRETAHTMVEKKGKAKDKFYGKLILELGNEVRSSVEQGTAAMEKADQDAIRRMIKESVDVAIAAERTWQANVRNNASGSRPVRGRDTALAISECAEGKKVKFDAATLEGPALTWWKTKVVTMGLETVNQMPWTEMKQLMTAEFCLIEDVQRMKHKLWNLMVKEYYVVAYTQRFNELALMCLRMVKPERVKVDAYIQGLTIISRLENFEILEGKKRKWENLQSGSSSGKSNQRDNYRHTLQNSQKQGNARAMVTALIDGKLPLCERCFTRHVGYCTINCHKCGKVGHKARYCKEKSVATGANAQPVWTCYDCGEQGHTRN
ncbi:putative reverse transcriptase domain-containing protein [Tanacetum coccineum]